MIKASVGTPTRAVEIEKRRLSAASGGESLYGLVSGLRAAGAKTVVASLFAVDDLGTARLMKLFYEVMLRERVGPARALRAAALEAKTDGAPPKIWASFVSYGELRSAPLVLKRSEEGAAVDTASDAVEQPG